MSAGPKLNWKPMEEYEGEYECHVGHIIFTVATGGQWDVCVRRKGGQGLIIINCGDAKSLTAAKRKCQQWLDRQWKAMCKLEAER